MQPDTQPLFEVRTPLGFTIRTTPAYWSRVLVKHPDLRNRLEDVKRTLSQPDEIRRSSRDPNVLLFYRSGKQHWLVAVGRRTNGDGFLVTAYQTNAVKEGERIWPK